MSCQEAERKFLQIHKQNHPSSPSSSSNLIRMVEDDWYHFESHFHLANLQSLAINYRYTLFTLQNESTKWSILLDGRIGSLNGIGSFHRNTFYLLNVNRP